MPCPTICSSGRRGWGYEGRARGRSASEEQPQRSTTGSCSARCSCSPSAARPCSRAPQTGARQAGGQARGGWAATCLRVPRDAHDARLPHMQLRLIHGGHLRWEGRWVGRVGGVEWSEGGRGRNQRLLSGCWVRSGRCHEVNRVRGHVTQCRRMRCHARSSATAGQDLGKGPVPGVSRCTPQSAAAGDRAARLLASSMLKVEGYRK